MPAMAEFERCHTVCVCVCGLSAGAEGAGAASAPQVRHHIPGGSRGVWGFGGGALGPSEGRWSSCAARRLPPDAAGGGGRAGGGTVARLLLQADAGDDEVEYEDATSSDDEEMVEVRAALESVVRQLGELGKRLLMPE
eukprot:COSAG01_NODE_423_length_17260_cov_203.736962_2_plen_138_part_00